MQCCTAQFDFSTLDEALTSDDPTLLTHFSEFTDPRRTDHASNIFHGFNVAHYAALRDAPTIFSAAFSTANVKIDAELRDRGVILKQATAVGVAAACGSLRVLRAAMKLGWEFTGPERELMVLAVSRWCGREGEVDVGEFEEVVVRKDEIEGGEEAEKEAAEDMKGEEEGDSQRNEKTSDVQEEGLNDEKVPKNKAKDEGQKLNKEEVSVPGLKNEGLHVKKSENYEEGVNQPNSKEKNDKEGLVDFVLELPSIIDGVSLLMVAAKYGCLKIVERLGISERFAGMLTEKDIEGRTALDYCLMQPFPQRHLVKAPVTKFIISKLNISQENDTS